MSMFIDPHADRPTRRLREIGPGLLGLLLSVSAWAGLALAMAQAGHAGIVWAPLAWATGRATQRWLWPSTAAIAVFASAAAALSASAASSHTSLQALAAMATAGHFLSAWAKSRRAA